MARANERAVCLVDRIMQWEDAARQRWPFTAIVGRDVDPATVEGDGSRLLLRPAIVGFIALAAITAGCAEPSSPFVLKVLDPVYPGGPQPPATGAWFFGIPSHATTAGLVPGLVLFYSGLLLFIRVWLLMARTLSRVPGVPVKKLAGVFALWMLPVLVAPPLLSHDIYSYAAQGEMITRHVTPYAFGPNASGLGSPYQPLVDRFWALSPAPYGPLFLQLDGWLVDVSFHNELGTLVLLRLLELAGVVMMAVGVTRLARSYGRDPSEAFVLAALNPVTVLHLVGGAHNDALMVGFLVLGLAFARQGRHVAGIVMCALGASVKAPAALGFVFIGWQWTGVDLPWRERVRPVLTACLIAGAVMAAISIETGLGVGWITSLLTPGTVTSWMAPATGVGLLLHLVMQGVGLGVSRSVVLSFTRLIGMVGAAIWVLWLLWRSDRMGMLKALGLSLLLVTILSPVVQPWYLSWGLILLAPVATGRSRTAMIAVSIASAFIQIPSGKHLLGELAHQNPLWVALGLLVALGALTVPFGSSRSGSRNDDHERELALAA